MNFIFWQNILSPHQAAFLRELAELPHDVTVVALEEMAPDRKSLGWQCSDLGRAEVIINPNEGKITNLVKTSSRDTIHILAGARWTPLGTVATKACIENQCRLGILTEAGDPRGMAGVARRLKYKGERLWRGRYYKFLLTMGQMGVDWFARSGYSKSRIFPFTYVTEDYVSEVNQNESNGDFEVLFVGRLIDLKGVDCLLRAFASIDNSEIKLKLVGDGEQRQKLCNLADELGVQDRLNFHGKMSQRESQIAMGKADLLVLPSYKDGWGAVVNEALMAGTPVICSDACGAAELIRYPWLGSVFPSGNVDSLAVAMTDWFNRGKTTEGSRQKIRQWADCISGKSVAQYFEAVLEHVYEGGARPEAPWRMKFNNERFDV